MINHNCSSGKISDISEGRICIKEITLDQILTIEEAAKITGRLTYLDKSVEIPEPESLTARSIVFFRPELIYIDRGAGGISSETLLYELAVRNLVPVNPYFLAEVNRKMSAKRLLGRPNATFWRDSLDRWCFLSYFKWGNEDSVCSGVNTGVWGYRWSFVCIKVKKTLVDKTKVLKSMH